MKMRRCEDEKMRDRPPLLEEPCAQTLSGKNNRAKGVALETPDIKIIMYVYTPLNKVFGFHRSNQIFGG